jgi:hypothetical protein
MIEAGLYSLLTANAGLTALVGNRIYPVLVPEPPTYPCLSYQVVASHSTYTFEGKQLGSKLFQFDAWGTSFSDCKNILNALRNALDTYQGTLTDGTRVLCALSEQEIDQFEEDSRVYRSLAEYRIEYVEPS